MALSWGPISAQKNFQANGLVYGGNVNKGSVQAGQNHDRDEAATFKSHERDNADDK